MSHTPGPWTVEPCQDTFEVGILDKDGDLVAVTYNQKCVANARLMAAAPDLLDACKAILDDLNGIMPPELVQRFGSSRILLRNAVTKAEGREA